MRKINSCKFNTLPILTRSSFVISTICPVLITPSIWKAASNALKSAKERKVAIIPSLAGIAAAIFFLQLGGGLVTISQQFIYTSCNFIYKKSMAGEGVDNDFLASSSGLQKSLQPCKVTENEEKLLGLIDVYTRRKAKLKVQILEALLFILRQLLAESSFSDTRGRGFLEFDDAYGLFISFFYKHLTKQEFRTYLLHKEYGLRVCVATINCTR